MTGWLEQFRARHRSRWRRSLEIHAFPHIGDKPIAEVSTADVLALLSPVWTEKRDMAGRVRQRLERIFDWAILYGYRETANPASKHLLTALPRKAPPVRHMPSLPYAEVPAAIRAIELSTARPLTRLCFRFMVLTAARPGEARGARWDEIDLDAAVWTVPAERMEMNKPHRVPLSAQAVQILQDARDVLDRGDYSSIMGRSTSGLVFPSSRDKAITDVAPLQVLKRLNIAAVPHGFCSSFRDWCAENEVPRDYAEASLSHTLGQNRVEAAYFRTDLLEQRRSLMQAWADFCTGG